MPVATKADSLLSEAIRIAGLNPSDPPETLFAEQDRIKQALQRMNSTATIPVSSTGTITERVCEWALKTAIPNGYTRLGQNEKWMGDFSLMGYPFAALLTVKSFKAKERLIASGLGLALAPTIAFGWFDDPTEFSAARCHSYRDKAFAAIYMPADTLANIAADARSFANSNQRTLLRDVLDLPRDLRAALKSSKYGTLTLPAVRTAML
jgi:hypothetical protein